MLPSADKICMFFVLALSRGFSLSHPHLSSGLRFLGQTFLTSYLSPVETLNCGPIDDFTYDTSICVLGLLIAHRNVGVSRSTVFEVKFRVKN